MRSGIVGERLKFFDGMAADTEANHQYIVSPPPPSLEDIPNHLPDPARLPPVPYTVQLSTANSKWAGTDKEVFMQLVGDFHSTDFIHLREGSENDMQSSLRYCTPDNFSSATSRSDFPVGSIREFRFKASPVGNLVRVCIRHDPTEDHTAAWKLDRVVIRNEDLQRSWSFLCSRWLSRDMGNQVDLTPCGEISAGRRASRRASRRLSTGKNFRISHAAESSLGAEHFASMRDRFGGDGAQDTEEAVSKGTESGTRRVCFQLQKFTGKSCHVYLLGQIPALGGWRPERALRMTMQSAADGTWRGEWRLELEIDDDYDDISYIYMIVNESDSKHSRRVECKDRLRRFRLSSPDSLGRTTEGGRIHIRDSFGSNKFGLPSASRSMPSTPSLGLRKALSRTESIKTPRGEATLMSGSLGPERGADQYSVPQMAASPRNLDSALDNVSNEQSIQSDNFVKDSVLMQTDENLEEPKSQSDDLMKNPFGVSSDEDFLGNEHVHMSDNGVEEDGLNGHTSDLKDAAESSTSPREDIQRDGEEARREWEVQLNASDGQLFKSAQRLLRRQSEVMYLKKRNSREVSEAPNSPMLLSLSPKSPDKTSPVSSDGIREDENFNTGDGNRTIELTHSEIRKPLVEERIGLLAQVERLENEVERKDKLHRNVVSTHRSLEVQLQELRGKMSEQCEEYDAQQAELVRLVMDGQEAYRAFREQLVAERDNLHQRWAKEFKTRRKLFNTIQELRGNIRVFCRVRPLKESSVQNDSASSLAVSFPDASVGENARIDLGSKCFEFDHVFQPSATQTAIYEETAGVVASVLDGYNVCVFAYGQTGSGKTHTMNGPDSDRGVNYRALVDLFDLAAQRAEFSEVRIAVSMMEIYNENLRDLIRIDEASSAPKLEIRKDPNSSSPTAVHVPNLTEVEVDSVESVWAVMERGSINRKKGKTNMNEHSSRSHLIIKVTVACEDFSSGVKSSGVLHLVDLAGSERVGRSNVSGERLKEAQHINKSLATLGDVFMALLTHSGHVPYRNSRLTYLLQDSLGGDSKTLMFVNVSADESDSAETLSSLLFAQRVAKVELGSARKHTEKTAEVKAVVTLQQKEAELQDLSSKFFSLQRELRKRDDSAEDVKQRTRALEQELKAARSLLEEQNRRESAGREGSAQEVKDIRAQLEKGQLELRAAKQKTKDVVISKDDEINRLNAMLKAKDRRIAELNRQSSRQVDRVGAPSSSRLNRPASTPNVSSRKPERTPMTKLPRNAATFTAQSRRVRFEDPQAEAEVSSDKESEELTLMPPPATPVGAARRAREGALVRSQTMAAPRPQRQSSRGNSAGKTVTYAFGTRVESNAADVGASQKPARNVRLPRAQTNLIRPAQRVSQLPNGRSGQPTLTGAGRAGSNLRRAGTFAGVHRTPSGSGQSKLAER